MSDLQFCLLSALFVILATIGAIVIGIFAIALYNEYALHRRLEIEHHRRHHPPPWRRLRT
jgi:hypothetical protein